MRQKSILEQDDDFDFDSDVGTDFEDSFPVEISNEVTHVHFFKSFYLVKRQQFKNINTNSMRVVSLL